MYSYTFMTFQILMTANVQIIVFWDVTPCSLADSTNILEKPADTIMRAQHGGSSFLYLSTELHAIRNEDTRIGNNFHVHIL